MTYAPLAPSARISPAPALDDTLRYLCSTLTPVPGHAPLLDALRKKGGPEFSVRLSRGGWFRPGRIVDAQHETIAADALAWLEQQWAACGDDGAAFAEEFADSGLYVSLEQGISHYLVSPKGKDPTDYLQLEIEELTEVLSHPLGARTPAAESVEGLLDRPAGSPPLSAIGAPHYRFRRLTDIGEYITRIDLQTGKPAPVLRFLREWTESSAGKQGHFSNHWVLALSEHLDRYRQTRIGAVPVAAHAPHWAGTPGARGTTLAQQLHDFDRAAGYGFAWYFHLVSAHRVPRSVAPEVFADLQDGMAYLPERDAALIRAWMHDPYAL